jgi:hypothetical protein
VARFVAKVIVPFLDRLGYIRYYCQAKIERVGFLKFDKTIIRPFTIIPHFDLNTVPNIDAAIQIEGSKNIGVLMFKHGRIYIKVIYSKDVRTLKKSNKVLWSLIGMQ